MKKISLQIMLAIIICSITTSTILCIVSITKTSSVMNSEIEKTLSHASGNYSNQLNKYFKNTEGMVEAIAANVKVTFEPEKMKEDPEYFNDYKKYLDSIIKETLTNSDIAFGLYFTFAPELTAPFQDEVWYILDKEEQPKVVNANLNLNSRDFSQPVKENMQYYFQPIKTNRGAWTGPYLDPDVKFEMLSYSKAVYVDGVLIGVAGSDILTDDTIDIVKTMKLYDESSSFLFDGEENLIVSSLDSNNEQHSENEAQIKKHLAAKENGILHYVDSGEEYILAYSRLSNDWTLGITQPTDAVFSNARGIVIVLSLLTILSIVITVFFAIYFAKKFSRPITSASDELKLLKIGDYTHQIPEEFLKRKDDFGEFYDAILAIQESMRKEAESNREKDILMIYQSKQAKIGEMVGNISHQWKQPLNTINLILLNLYDDYRFQELSQEEFKNTIDKLMGIVKNMSQTINDFNDFLRPDKEKSDFSLFEATELALDLMETSLKYNQINAEVFIDKEIKVWGYQNEFSHVLFNVLNNARDAIIESGLREKTIKIKASREGEIVKVEIFNSGNSMDEEVLKNVFEPYYTTKRDRGGTGIGLYISKIIVEQRMQGTIELENEEPGVCCRINLKGGGES